MARELCPNCRGEPRPAPPSRSPMEGGVAPPYLVDDPPGQACPACGGLWLPRPAWMRFVADAETRAGRQTHPALARTPVAGRRDSIVSRACPECRRYMARQTFGRLSGVRVDVCYRHGVWLDAGELAAVRTFIVQGGLRLSRQLAAGRKDAYQRWEDLWKKSET